MSEIAVMQVGIAPAPLATVATPMWESEAQAAAVAAAEAIAAAAAADVAAEALATAEAAVATATAAAAKATAKASQVAAQAQLAAASAVKELSRHAALAVHGDRTTALGRSASASGAVDAQAAIEAASKAASKVAEAVLAAAATAADAVFQAAAVAANAVVEAEALVETQVRRVTVVGVAPPTDDKQHLAILLAAAIEQSRLEVRTAMSRRRSQCAPPSHGA